MQKLTREGYYYIILINSSFILNIFFYIYVYFIFPNTLENIRSPSSLVDKDRNK